jgi:hypothetical protein
MRRQFYNTAAGEFKGIRATLAPAMRRERPFDRQAGLPLDTFYQSLLATEPAIGISARTQLLALAHQPPDLIFGFRSRLAPTIHRACATLNRRWFADVTPRSEIRDRAHKNLRTIHRMAETEGEECQITARGNSET